MKKPMTKEDQAVFAAGLEGLEKKAADHAKATKTAVKAARSDETKRVRFNEGAQATLVEPPAELPKQHRHAFEAAVRQARVKALTPVYEELFNG